MCRHSACNHNRLHQGNTSGVAPRDNPVKDRDIYRLETGGQIEATAKTRRARKNPYDRNLRALDYRGHRGEIGIFAGYCHVAARPGLTGSPGVQGTQTGASFDWCRHLAVVAQS
jgi:hypothetical protein